jgi:hypothetical protein
MRRHTFSFSSHYSLRPGSRSQTMAREPMRLLLARDVDLAAGLGLPVGKLRQVLADVRPARRRKDSKWYRWSDLTVPLDSRAMVNARRVAREAMRRRVTGSRYHVAGFPHLVAQWDVRNVLLPHEVSHGSPLKAWWKCKAGPDHEWRACVALRVRGTGCPFCRNKRVSVTNSLKTCHPNIAAQWHPTKNGELTPNDVIRSSGVRVWWKCPEGSDHEWNSSVHNRTARSIKGGCPFCSSTRVSETNSLAAQRPEVAREWSRRNGRLKPDHVTQGSPRRVWWQCPKQRNHVWKAAIGNRTVNGSGCPFCSKRRATPENTLATRSPKAARMWHPTKNGLRDPTRVSFASKKAAWWLCRCGYAWKQRICTAAERTCCPRCEFGSPS